MYTFRLWTNYVNVGSKWFELFTQIGYQSDWNFKFPTTTLIPQLHSYSFPSLLCSYNFIVDR